MFEQAKQPEKSVLSGRSGSSKKSTPNTELLMKQLKRNMTGPLQMFADEEEEKQLKSIFPKTADEELQKKETPGSPGSKTNMPDDVKSKMENSFGTDFSDVNIHQNSDQAANLGALAYTQGNDVHFAPGQYEPGNQKGQELLGHELTHVVQQREGRVKPDTEQHKGININSDTTLEKEADEMGTRAAQGKMVNVRGNGSGVQMQDRPLPDHIKNGKIFGLDIIGYGYGPYKEKGLLNVFEDYVYSEKLILAGSSDNWKKLLNYCNDPDFKKYILPFIIETGVFNYPGIESPYPNSMENLSFWETKKQRDVSNDDIKELLKALYDTDKSTESKVDFENTIWESTSNVPAAYELPFDGLSAFIEKYQTLVIQEVSADRDVRKMNLNDIKKLSEQSTKFYEPGIGESRVVTAMIQNAVATAINAVKKIIEYEGATEEEIDLNKAVSYDMIKNSGLIINGALEGYEGIIENTKTGAESIFDSVWSLIPFSGSIVKLGASHVKKVLKKNFVKVLAGSNGKNIVDYKESLHSEFENALEEFRSEGFINSDSYSDMSDSFMLYLFISE